MKLLTRNKQFDIIKGIAILCVVIGHAINESIFYNYELVILRKFIYILHLPIFFFCSGYFFLDKYNFKEFFIKKVKSLYLPFVLFGFLFVFIDIFRGYSVNSLVREVFFILIFKNYNSYAGALWFVPFLFLTELLYFSIQKFKNQFKFGNIYILIISIVFASIGILLLRNDIDYYNIDISCLMIPVMFMGSLYKKYEAVIKKFITNWLWLLAGALIIIINLISQNEIELAVREYYGNIFLFYMMIVLGIIFCLSISFFIYNFSSIIAKLIMYVGKSSYYIMALHFFIFKVIDLCYYKIFGSIYNIDIKTMYYFPYSYPQLRFLYIFLGIFFSMVVFYFVGKTKNLIYKGVIERISSVK
ncbi:acyltransferase family protein [Thomasclavelia cocleata]|uniref:acyltransferase family protein n=1 Tax=Thomasclavelia cocleata TaxID=69824 RepID=UPI00272B598E|nr:acyltransferase family protein [Thomasclavelia cocleata]